MLRSLRTVLLSACAVAVLPLALARAQDTEDLPPYKMVRSLQFVQDSVVLGDHSAADMQSFMLGALDKRLRTADQSVFDDPRNVDAALIYAMSGGNPATLHELASRDIEGNFDSRITDALQQYLDGKGGLVVEGLTKAIPEYRNSRIGPYLYLVLGNSVSQQDPAKALQYYDWARLTSPGTNIEEAALRRSVALATRTKLTDKGYAYSLSYARRFLTSPYASQFADVFVELAVATFSAQTEPKIQAILSFMDRPRQREVYLRIARRAAIGGMQELAGLASGRAEALSDDADVEPKALANLYSGLVGVPSAEVASAMADITAIPDSALSPRDLALREAAATVAKQVLQLPQAEVSQPESLAQAPDPTVVAENDPNVDSSNSGSGESPFAAPESQVASNAAPPSDAPDAAPDSQDDPALGKFLDTGRSKLAEIDALLKEEK